MLMKEENLSIFSFILIACNIFIMYITVVNMHLFNLKPKFPTINHITHFKSDNNALAMKEEDCLSLTLVCCVKTNDGLC